MQNLVTSVLAVLAVASALLSVITLTISLRIQKVSPAELIKQVHVLQSDLQDIYDRVDHWQRRDRVRNLRASQVVATPPAPIPGSPEYKALLRAKAAIHEVAS